VLLRLIAPLTREKKRLRSGKSLMDDGRRVERNSGHAFSRDEWQQGVCSLTSYSTDGRLNSNALSLSLDLASSRKKRNFDEYSSQPDRDSDNSEWKGSTIATIPSKVHGHGVKPIFSSLVSRKCTVIF
jgi:hypothetical protein